MKANCKYWDKCYQRNQAHLDKFNHPPKDGEEELKPIPIREKEAPKRKVSSDESDYSDYDDDMLLSGPTIIVPENIAGRAELYRLKVNANKSPNSWTRGDKTSASAETSNGGMDSLELEELRDEAIGNIAGKNYQQILEKRILISAQQEYDKLLESNDFIRHKFLVEMPEEFYDFWDVLVHYFKCKEEDLLKVMEKKYDILLVGPFEYLGGRFHGASIYEPGDYLRHWRFYFDPPEFQTVFVRRGTCVHYGYWRDTPQDKEKLLLARNDSMDGCKFEFIAGNIFEAFVYFLEHEHKTTPFTAANRYKLIKAMNVYIEKNRENLCKKDVLEMERNKKVVAKTFHRGGIVVPFERRTQQGYRPLIVSDAELKKILDLFDKLSVEDANDKVEGENADDKGVSNEIKKAVLEKLQPVANAANIAMDECDFGTPFELGIDLFCSGRKELHMIISSLLVPAYSMLKRPQFIAISKAHTEKRSDDFKLSVFDLNK